MAQDNYWQENYNQQNNPFPPPNQNSNNPYQPTDGPGYDGSGINPGPKSPFDVGGMASGGFQSNGFDPFGGSMGGQWGGRANDLWSMLMGRAGQGLDVGAKDPIIANQTNAFRAEHDRGTKHYLEKVA